MLISTIFSGNAERSVVMLCLLLESKYTNLRLIASSDKGPGLIEIVLTQGCCCAHFSLGTLEAEMMCKRAPSMALMSLVAVLQLSQCMAAGLAYPTSLAAAAGRPNPLECPARSGVPRLRAASLRVAAESALRLKGGLAEDEGFDALGDGNVMVDVSGDGGVIKMVTRKGLGKETPVHGDEAFAHFNGTLSHINEREKEWNGTTVGGKLFDSSSLQGRYPRAFRLDDSEAFPRGLELGLLSMAKGERATLLVKPGYAYGENGKRLHNGVFIPPNSTLKYDVEMMRWNERDLFNDEGVIVRKKTALSELPTGASMSHPDATDEVLISFKAECNGVVFDQTEGDKEWVTLGSGRLPVGAEVAIVREGIRGGKMELVLSGAYGFGEAGLQPHVGCNETVTYNVELHDWNNVRDMYDDGSVIVRLIGQSDDMYTMQCKDGCKIDVHVEGRTADGDVFLHNSSYTNLSVGGGVLPEAVESALELVRQGQAASFAIKADRTFEDAKSGKFPFGQRLTKDTEWRILVEKIRRPYELSHEEKAEAATVRKNRGNQLFKEGRIDEAMEKYQAAFALVQFVKDSEACADLKFALHLNKAAVLQKIAASKEGDRALDDWRSVVSEATNALEMKAHSAKALFRRGVAYMNLDELELARTDLASCAEIDPGNAQAKLRISMIDKQQRAQDAKSQGVYSKMFTGKKADADSTAAPATKPAAASAAAAAAAPPPAPPTPSPPATPPPQTSVADAPQGVDEATPAAPPVEQKQAPAAAKPPRTTLSSLEEETRVGRPNPVVGAAKGAVSFVRSAALGAVGKVKSVAVASGSAVKSVAGAVLSPNGMKVGAIGGSMLGGSVAALFWFNGGSFPMRMSAAGKPKMWMVESAEDVVGDAQGEVPMPAVERNTPELELDKTVEGKAVGTQ